MLYDSAFEVNKLRGLLNIAHQDYYVNDQYYGYNLKKDSLFWLLIKPLLTERIITEEQAFQ
jgi:hypothetical protein